ncbi:MAG: DMT family transporter [Anaerolineales bacterium]|nr:MAG: DMT family transporter [Anaerolineales bacterium]
MKNLLLYLTTVLIWGSTWLAIKFQLGETDPVLSVAYRFTLASLLLLGFSKLRGLNLRFSPRQHLLIALQGVLLFSINYLLVYLAELHLTSGLVAVVFSTLVFMNIFMGALLLGTPVRWNVVLGGALGLIGVALVFFPELRDYSLQDKGIAGLLLSFVSTLLASLGNITAARNQRSGLPVVQTNAYGMGYGAIAMYAYAVIAGVPFSFSVAPAYLGSLIYLAIFGSMIAFGAYLTLLGRIGADRAAYTSLLFPLVALGISTLFEGYAWNSSAILGVMLVIAGNLLILSWKRLKTYDTPKKLNRLTKQITLNNKAI